MPRRQAVQPHNVRMVADAEIAPQVVPVHDQQVLSALHGLLVTFVTSSETYPALKPDTEPIRREVLDTPLIW